MTTTSELEKQRAHVIAEEYRKKDYEVIEEPSKAQLPDFLSGYRPDILVRGDNETVVVEVKSRKSLRKNDAVRQLALLLQSRPDWRFELVIVGEREESILPEGIQQLSKADISRRIEDAERLLESGSSEAALLIAWSASEAIVRQLTENEKVLLERITPLHILNEAVSNGVISRDDYNFMTNAMKYRNALVHGFKVSDFDSRVVSELIDRARRLIQSTNGPQDAE